MSFTCFVCRDCTWVCEAHPDVPYGDCSCGSDGVFCPHCDPMDKQESSELPTAFTFTIRNRQFNQH